MKPSPRPLGEPEQNLLRLYRTHLRSQDRAASRLSNSLTKQRLILVVA